MPGVMNKFKALVRKVKRSTSKVVRKVTPSGLGRKVKKPARKVKKSTTKKKKSTTKKKKTSRR